MSTEFDLDNLMRMDTGARYAANSEAVKGGWKAPNEVRRKEQLPPVAGGDSPYLQQQNYSLAALAKRDAKEDPFATKPATPAPAEPPTEPANAEKAMAALAETFIKGLDDAIA